MTTAEDQPIPVGTRVRLKGTREAGVVIHHWHDKELDCFDYYIAFFGKRFTKGKPARIPYVLRYLGSSLDIVD